MISDFLLNSIRTRIWVKLILVRNGPTKIPRWIKYYTGLLAVQIGTPPKIYDFLGICVASKKCDKINLFSIEQLVVAQLVNKSLIFYGTLKIHSCILDLQSD